MNEGASSFVVQSSKVQEFKARVSSVLSLEGSFTLQKKILHFVQDKPLNP